MDIKKRIKKVALVLVASAALGYVFLKGVETIQYKQLPKEQQKMFNSLKAKNIPNSVILIELKFLDSAQKALNEAKIAIDAGESEQAQYHLNKAEEQISKIKYLDVKSAIPDLEKIKSDLSKGIKAQKIRDKE